MSSERDTRPRPSFYKRPLPASCTAFHSPEGKALFKTALLEGFLECYFTLASSLETQSEPAYCALATLSICLNALEVDPMRHWKSAWRIYSQEMLDCCRPLADIAVDGITLAEFICLAQCNGLEGEAKSGGTTALEEFEADLQRVCSAPEANALMAVSYSRKTLGQTGDGHFSPVAGYCKSARKVLVLDVARFKYPSYWLDVDLLYQAMQPLDKATGQPRGYSVLRVATDKVVLSPYKTSYNKQSYRSFLKELKALDLPPGAFESNFNALARLVNPAAVSVRVMPATTSEEETDAIDLKDRLAACEAALKQITPKTPSNLVGTRLLFVLALLQCRSAPPSIRQLAKPFFERVGELPPALSTEVAFLQGQLDSLGSCCSAEKLHACACNPTKTS